VNQTSGLAGIAHWINSYFALEGDKRIDKKDKRVIKIKEWVDQQYINGRVTSIGDEELEEVIHSLAPDIFD
jgi:hypothetical protein